MQSESKLKLQLDGSGVDQDNLGELVGCCLQARLCKLSIASGYDTYAGGLGN